MNKLFIFGLSLLCFAIYFNSLNNDFILDDYALVVNNPLIKSAKSLGQIFKISPYDAAVMDRDISYDKMYRPLQLLSYSIDYKIWGLNPSGFRLTNILLHLINSILIYYLFSLIFNVNIAKIISLFFAVHPLNTSVVVYIAGRADLLASFFMLFSIILFFRFIQSKKKIYYLLSFVSAAFALLSRENALLLSGFIFLFLFFLKARPKEFFFVIPFIILNVSYICLRVILFGGQGMVLHPSFMPLPLRFLNFFNIVPRYLLLLLLPLDLHLFRVTPFIGQIIGLKSGLSAGFIFLYLFLIIKFRNNRLLFFSMLWFLFWLIPVFFYLDGYSILGQAMMAENWLYLSSAGFFAGFVFIRKAFKNLGKALIISAAIFYGFLTTVNNSLWKNGLVFYRNILEYTSKGNPLRKNLIKEYLNRGLYEDALAEIKKFSLDFPGSEDLYIFQGNYYYETGRINAAIENYGKALRKNKNLYAYYDLSLCYEKLGQLDKAVYFATEAVKMKPHYLAALVQLGDLYSQKKEFNQAERYYRAALEIEPGNKIVQDKIKNAK
ncbi:MAG: tetratricopeptide repeat protein [Candidatus Omnitrophota bacterium]|jgi:tetratricopeptide (TPR) repeat protein